MVDYFVPVLPSLFLLLDALLPRKLMVVTLVVFLSYHIFDFNLLGGESGRRRLTFEPYCGFTVEDSLLRVSQLRFIKAANAYTPPRPTVLLFGAPYIRIDPHWEWKPNLGVYKKKDVPFYIGGVGPGSVKLVHRFYKMGFDVYIFRLRKSPFENASDQSWRSEVRIIHLDDLFGRGTWLDCHHLKDLLLSHTKVP